jgi:MFS family permease
VTAMPEFGHVPGPPARYHSAMIFRRSAKMALFMVMMINSLANGLFIPLSLLYLVSRSGASLTQIGVLLSVAGLIALPTPLLTGRLADRFDARAVVLTAQVLQAAGFAGYVVATALPIVFAAAVVASLGRTAFWPSIYVLLSGLSDQDPDPRARERWFGATGSLRAAGYGVGALIAGLTLTVNSRLLYQGVIAGNAILLMIASGLLVRFVPRRTVADVSAPSDQPRGYRVLWADRPFLVLVAINTIFALCNVLLSIGYAPFITRGLPQISWAIGPLLAMNTVIQALFLPLMVRLLHGLRRHVSLCLAGVLWACWSLTTTSALYLPVAWKFPCLAVAVLCYSAAQMIHSPVSNAMSADAAPIDVRGRYLAIFQSSFAIATVAAPTLFSTLLSLGNAVPWLVLALLALVTIPSLLLLRPHLPEAAVTGIRRSPTILPIPDRRTPPTGELA